MGPGTVTITPDAQGPVTITPDSETAPHAQPRPYANPSLPEVSAAPPQMGVMEQLYRDFPIIERAKYGIEHAFGNTATTPKQQALQKVPEAVQNQAAFDPSQGLTAQEQQAHPMITGAAQFAGGLTTPTNLALSMASGGLGKLPGAAGAILPRVASGIFSGQMLKDAYDQIPDFKAAYQRGDLSETERIFTHLVLGTAMAGLGLQHATLGEPKTGVDQNTLENYRKAGQDFGKLKQKNITLNNITEHATGLYNSIKQDLTTHQEALRADGVKTIQDAIDADTAASMNTQRGSIPTPKLTAETAKILETTNYEMKPGERKLYNEALNKPELTLEQAKQLRTRVGRLAFGRSSLTPEMQAVFTSMYNELGSAMKDRITDIQGSSRPYDHYNNQMRASFELEKGISGEMMENLQGQDRHAAMPKMKAFADANLSEIQEQMRKIGLNEQADRLGKSQSHADSLTGAYDTTHGKYASGIMRLFMQNPKEAWPGLAVMMAGHGMGLPFPVPQLLGAVTASEYIRMRGKARAGAIGSELQNTLPSSAFRTRTQAEAPETFKYKNPDEGWTPPPKPSAPTNPKGRYSTPSSTELETRGKQSVERRKQSQPVAVERRATPEGMDLLAQRAFQETLSGKGNPQGIDTDAYTKAMVQARQELGKDATVEEVIKRRDEIVGTKARPSGDIGAQMRAKNPEPTRAEVKAARLRKMKGR